MFITHNDAQLYAVEFGSSPRTFLAFGGWVDSWELWTEPFTTLSQSWRTIAYDHRGSGATVAPVESITVETMVSDVFAIMDAFNIDQCVLAAESAGTIIALLAALQQPQRFQGLVLVDGMCYRPVSDQADSFMMGLKNNYEATLDQFVETCVPEPNSTAIKRWGRQIVGRASQAAAIQLYECIYGIDLRAQVSQLTQPTLILHGEHDKLVPVSAAEWLATQIPQCHLHVIKGAGHVPTVTRPKEIAETINQYFETIE